MSTFLLLLQSIHDFLRPIEVCRLKIEDIDSTGKTLTVKAKKNYLSQRMKPF